MREIDPERVLKDVGRRIAEYRAARGMTQERLAESIGVSVRYIQSVEAGTENLTVRSLVVYANVFRVRVGDLFRSTDRTTSGGRR